MVIQSPHGLRKTHKNSFQIAQLTRENRIQKSQSKVNLQQF